MSDRIYSSADAPTCMAALKLAIDMRQLQKEFFRERNMDRKRDLLAKSKAAEKAFDDAAAKITSPQQGFNL